MSYLVDALKKAERERHQRKGADMHALSAGEASFERRGNGRLMVWIVSALIMVNIAFLIYLLFPYGDNETVTARSDAATPAQSAPAPVAAPTTTNPPASEPPAVVRQPAQPAHAQNPAAAPAPQPQPQKQRALTGLRLSDDPQGQWSQPRSQSRGSVTYSSQPLDDDLGNDDNGEGNYDTQYDTPAPSRQAPSARDLGGSVPQVTINGQLYSSVPGRSFILVGGRRYHEGERMAAGPAVESIDRKGATLNYRGRRYHVEGPG